MSWVVKQDGTGGAISKQLPGGVTMRSAGRACEVGCRAWELCLFSNGNRMLACNSVRNCLSAL